MRRRRLLNWRISWRCSKCKSVHTRDKLSHKVAHEIAKLIAEDGDHLIFLEKE